MGDFQNARRQMVDCQIRPNDVTDLDIINAFSSLPRELFVPASHRSIAYIDSDIPLEISEDERFLMQVMPFAKMLQSVEIRPSDVVLCVGSGCGYGAGIISRLAGSVVATDPSKELVDRSSDTLSEMGIDNVAVIESDVRKGCPSEAPFDVIFIEGSVPAVPDALFQQLHDGGRLVSIVGEGLSSRIEVYKKSEGDISVTKFGNVAVPQLPGCAVEETFVF